MTIDKIREFFEHAFVRGYMAKIRGSCRNSNPHTFCAVKHGNPNDVEKSAYWDEGWLFAENEE